MPMENTRIIAVTNTFVGTAVEEMSKHHISRTDQIKALACLRSAEFLNSYDKLNHNELIKTVQTALIDTEIMDYLEPLHRSHLKAFPGAKESQATNILNLFNDQLIKAIEDIAKTEIIAIKTSDRCSMLKQQEINKIELLTQIAKKATPYTVNDLTLTRHLQLKRMILCANIFSVIVALVLSGIILFKIDSDSQPDNNDFGLPLGQLALPIAFVCILTLTYCIAAKLTKGLLLKLHHCIAPDAAMPRRSNLHQFNLLRSSTNREDMYMNLREITINTHSELEESRITTIETPLLNSRERVNHL